jgi:hypothetical protein
MSSVVPMHPDGVIPAVVAPPNQDVIQFLERALEDARAGQLRAMGYVLVDVNRAISTSWVGSADHHDMTAGVHTLAYRYMAAGRDG